MVTDDELLNLAGSGLSIPEIAARVAIVANVHRRIKRLTERVEPAYNIYSGPLPSDRTTRIRLRNTISR